MELYKKYRPKTLEEVIGQDGIVSSLRAYLDTNTLPHTILFTGSSGIGKTTIARILARSMGLSDSEIESSEYNMSDKDLRSIEGIKNLLSDMDFVSFTGKPKVYILDECDQITGDAQKELKKPLEDTPSHVYFFLCTTKPEKLVRDIRTRATEINLSTINPRVLSRHLRNIAGNEGIRLTIDLSNKIAEKANGSARQALVILDQIVSVDEDNREKVLDTIVLNPKDETDNLVQMLLNKKPWSEVKEAIKVVKDEAENVRFNILGYCNNVLLGSNPKMYSRAYEIISTMSDSYVMTGKAGLTRDCYTLCS